MSQKENKAMSHQEEQKYEDEEEYVFDETEPTYKGAPVKIYHHDYKNHSVEVITDHETCNDWQVKARIEGYDDVDPGNRQPNGWYAYTRYWTKDSDVPICTTGMINCAAVIVAAEVVDQTNEENFVTWVVALYHFPTGLTPFKDIYDNMVQGVQERAAEYGKISQQMQFLIPGQASKDGSTNLEKAVGKFDNNWKAMIDIYESGLKCINAGFEVDEKNKLVIKAYQIPQKFDLVDPTDILMNKNKSKKKKNGKKPKAYSTLSTLKSITLRDEGVRNRRHGRRPRTKVTPTTNTIRGLRLLKEIMEETKDAPYDQTVYV